MELRPGADSCALARGGAAMRLAAPFDASSAGVSARSDLAAVIAFAFCALRCTRACRAEHSGLSQLQEGCSALGAQDASLRRWSTAADEQGTRHAYFDCVVRSPGPLETVVWSRGGAPHVRFTVSVRSWAAAARDLRREPTPPRRSDPPTRAGERRLSRRVFLSPRGGPPSCSVRPHDRAAPRGDGGGGVDRRSSVHAQLSRRVGVRAVTATPLRQGKARRCRFSSKGNVSPPPRRLLPTSAGVAVVVRGEPLMMLSDPMEGVGAVTTHGDTACRGKELLMLVVPAP